MDSGPDKGTDYWHLSGVEGVQSDQGTYGVSLVLMLLLVVWCALFFAWRTHETRMAWAFGGFAGTAMLYGGDLRITEDLAASAYASGETVAAVGLFILALGCVIAVAANVPEPHGAVHAGLKGR
ncbi:hypothetical protein FAB82_26225 [Glycomyces buryatensis]|uniref:Uncharacterized protein n=1 Tax=Glycomyces buryatensis TaxID=2570927 RepID=A0A4S8Q0N6_9ACTN|nr:hypothetical protein FAB82_26225 [Glycomyces buryatensis]